MKAAIAHTYGGPEVVTIKDRPAVVPGPKDVLIRSHVATATAADWRLRSLIVPRGFALPFRLAMGWSRLRQPILGTVVAGEVVSVGEQVIGFAAGDRVVAMTGIKMGCHAELVKTRADGTIAMIPDALSYEEAAALPFGGTGALWFLRNQARVQARERVLILGGSGDVGSMAIQIAKYLGAHVTASASAPNQALLASLGADEVVDYGSEDPLTAHAPYDVIFDAVGTTTYARAAGALSGRGRFVMVIADLSTTLRTRRMGRLKGHKVFAGTAPERLEDVELLLELAVSGEISPVIDQTVPFDNIRAAHERLDTGRKRGSLLLTFDS